MEQIDVKMTFLLGDLEETIYMSELEGFVNKSKYDFMCLLKKSLYGLKQFPRQWYKRFDNCVMTVGFVRSFYDHFFSLRKIINL